MESRDQSLAFILDKVTEALSYTRQRLEAILQEARAWKMEAMTMRSIVHEIYQHMTGATGEPGNWSGARPVIEYIDALHEANRFLRSRERELLRDSKKNHLTSIRAGENQKGTEEKFKLNKRTLREVRIRASQLVKFIDDNNINGLLPDEQQAQLYQHLHYCYELGICSDALLGFEGDKKLEKHLLTYDYED